MFGLGTIDHSRPCPGLDQGLIIAAGEVIADGDAGRRATAHHTAFRRFSWGAELFGLGTIDHADPFQDSIRVYRAPPGEVTDGDAGRRATTRHCVQHVVLGGEALGLGTIDHSGDPFQDSIRV